MAIEYKIKTFDNVVERLVAICKNHPLVNQAETGDAWEISTGGNVVYPLCMIVPTGMQALEKEVEYSFNVICMDLVEPGESNQQRVLSQTSEILLDVISIYKHGGYAYDDEYKNTNSYYDYTNERSATFRLEPFTEKFDDNVAGWNMVFTITMFHDYSVCSWGGAFLTIDEIDAAGVPTVTSGTLGRPAAE